jgi:large subunit ribosomal protein L30
MLKITQIRSTIGRPKGQGKTLRALGIRRMNHTVVHRDTPQIRGMVFKIQHLVRLEELGADEDEA